MRSIVRSPAPILLLILSIPLAVSLDVIATGAPSPDLLSWLAPMNLIYLTAAVLLLVAMVGLRLMLRGKPMNEGRVLLMQAMVLLFVGCLIASFALVLGLMLGALGLVISAAAIAWIVLWLPPRIRRMSTVTKYVVNRSPEVVFDFLADRRNYPRWVEGVESVEMLTPEPIGPGTRFRERGRLPRIDIDGVEEIVDFEPSQRMTSRVLDRPRPHLFTYTFDSVEGGTQLTQRFDFERNVSSALLGGWFRQPSVQRRVQEHREQGRIRLTQILESGEP